jgi:hypothetical protein
MFNKFHTFAYNYRNNTSWNEGHGNWEYKCCIDAVLLILWITSRTSNRKRGIADLNHQITLTRRLTYEWLVNLVDENWKCITPLWIDFSAIFVYIICVVNTSEIIRAFSVLHITKLKILVIPIFCSISCDVCCIPLRLIKLFRHNRLHIVQIGSSWIQKIYWWVKLWRIENFSWWIKEYRNK